MPAARAGIDTQKQNDTFAILPARGRSGFSGQNVRRKPLYQVILSAFRVTLSSARAVEKYNGKNKE
jgi:hypothetical protein